MKSIYQPIRILALLLGILSSVAAHASTEFLLPASDGHSYSQKTLGKGKPVILLFLEGTCESCPGGIKDMNRLLPLLAGKVTVAGIVNLDQKATKTLSTRYHALFPILSDQTGKTISKLGGLASLDTALLTANGKVIRTWRGYNRASLKQLEKELASHGGPKLQLDLSSFPIGLQNGCAFGMKMN